jgi:hypothetical protein
LDGILAQGEACIIYLDAWEHHATHLENPYIREVALGGPDTATRAQVIWQVRVKGIMKDENGDILPTDNTASKLKFKPERWRDWIAAHESPKPKMRARINDDKPADPDPCSSSPDARYRGLENQLYRVEVHRSGTAETATFKWSAYLQ